MLWMPITQGVALGYIISGLRPDLQPHASSLPLKRVPGFTEISLLGAARAIVRFSHHMAAAPTWALPIYYERLLDAIAAGRIDVRPGRLEPRALTREWKHYPHLRLSRSEWRNQRLRRTA